VSAGIAITRMAGWPPGLGEWVLSLIYYILRVSIDCPTAIAWQAGTPQP
jgi:hypothetical protein